MLKKLNVATVQEVIRLAEAANRPEKPEEIDFSKMSTEEFAKMMTPKPEDIKLRNYLKSIPEDSLAELMALMWLGRSGDRKKEFPQLLDHAKVNMDHAASYIAEKAPLATYLRDGMK